MTKRRTPSSSTSALRSRGSSWRTTTSAAPRRRALPGLPAAPGRGRRGRPSLDAAVPASSAGSGESPSAPTSVSPAARCRTPSSANCPPGPSPPADTSDSKSRPSSSSRSALARILRTCSAVTPEAARTAEQVRRILAKALRLLEEGRLFESEVSAGGEGPGGQRALEGVRHRAAGETEVGAEGHSPEPADDAGTAASGEGRPRLPRPGAAGSPGSARRRGAAEVGVRQLDPRLRSALVEEDGVRRVVINSAYPLYEVRRGDLWYQLETALREVCVTIPEATVAEFERKVNELMLVSLALAERGRRGTKKSRPAADRRRQAGLWK